MRPTPRRHLLRLLAAALGIAALAAAAAGCGEGERNFGAEEFTELIAEAGAPLELHETLSSSDPTIQVRVIEAAGGGAGTMLVAADVARARNEFSRCEGAVSLVCYRAANVVLRFDELEPDQLLRISEALRTIESASKAT